MKDLFIVALGIASIMLLTAASCNTTKPTSEPTAQTQSAESKETTKESADPVVVSTENTEQSKESEEQQLDKGMAISPAKELASIKRTPCYGQCPMYRFTILDNGQIVYEGKRFVDKIGTYSGLLSAEDLATILKMAEETNYFDLEEKYDVPIADFPTCITSVTKDGKTKSVMNKQGAPASLKKFELYLDSLLDGLELTKLSDEVNY